MTKRSNIPAQLACLAIALLLGAGIASLFLLRFQQGDLYPVYSSLRADPLGTRVLHDSLALCGGISVERNFSDLNRRLPSADTTLLLLGDTTRGADAIPRGTAAGINSFVRRGGRLFITFLPRNRAPEEPRDDEPDGDDESPDASEVEEPDAEEDPDGHEKHGRDDDEQSVSLADWLQIDFDDDAILGDALAQRTTNAAPTLPRTISCHTSMFFVPAPLTGADASEDAPLAPALDATNGLQGWATIYERDGKPLIIEREMGKGSIVLSTPTYFVSNEAMLKERHPSLLAWMAGSHVHIVFDEWHHGVSRNPNIASLAWSYNLQWTALLLVLLAALFIWQNGVGLVPPDAAGRGQDLAAGRDSASGLANLLRRNVSRDRVLEVCFAEWRRAQPHIGTTMHPKLARVQALIDEENAMPPGKRRLARAYNAISETLAKTAEDKGDSNPPRDSRPAEDGFEANNGQPMEESTWTPKG